MTTNEGNFLGILKHTSFLHLSTTHKFFQIYLKIFRISNKINKKKTVPVHNNYNWRTHQLAAAELVALFFNFFNSFDAQMDSVFALLCLLLLPCANISLIGSRSSRVIMGGPKALHKSPTKPAATAIVLSEWSGSWATTRMNWTMNGTCGSSRMSSGDGVVPSPFKPIEKSNDWLVFAKNHYWLFKITRLKLLIQQRIIWGTDKSQVADKLKNTSLY